MKKILLIAALVVFGLTNVKAQTFKIGGSLGVPVGDASTISSFMLGADVYYYFTNIDAPLELGLNAGFRNFFGKEWEAGGFTFDAEDFQFLPLAVAGRVKLVGILTGGADVGYAVGINDGNDGGFYFRPVVGIDIADTIEINASYESVSKDGSSIGNFNVGILFEL